MDMEETKEVDTERYAEVKSKRFSWLYQLDKFGVEVRGIERVTPEERDTLALKPKNSPAVQFLYVFGMWFAACGGLTSMSSFFLPTLVFGLNLKDSLVSGLVSLNFGCLVAAYCSTMGPRSGCRQMVGARFIFGPWGVKFICVLCAVSLVGWSIVNCIIGGQILNAISGCRLEVGIVVISVVSLVVAVFGMKVLFRFQSIFAVTTTIAMILYYVVVFKKVEYIHQSNEAVAKLGYDAFTVRGNWLSFFTIGFSVTASWGGLASDYYIMFPESTSFWQVFTVTFFGIAVPTTFVAVSGTYCQAIAFGYKPWYDAYESSGVGGLISETFTPWGNFGKFVAVCLYISLICNNIINTYSGVFDIQVIDSRLAVVPRWVYAILITVVSLVLSLVGKDNFSSIIGNFLPMLGYWISIYIAILLEENLIFRNPRFKRNFEYNWDNWDQPKMITYGLAAVTAFAAGAVGAVVGMNQVYWLGPIARKIGDFGGDIGFFLCFAFAGIVYLPLRTLELSYFKK